MEEEPPPPEEEEGQVVEPEEEEEEEVLVWENEEFKDGNFGSSLFLFSFFVFCRS
jgi:hypothetical protein